jgi:hypothetical protein
LGLATARHRLGDAAGAAGALTEALARHVIGRGLEALAGAVVRDAGAPGWCSPSGDGTVTVGPHGLERQVEVKLDGRRAQRAGGR